MYICTSRCLLHARGKPESGRLTSRPCPTARVLSVAWACCSASPARADSARPCFQIAMSDLRALRLTTSRSAPSEGGGGEGGGAVEDADHDVEGAPGLLAQASGKSQRLRDTAVMRRGSLRERVEQARCSRTVEHRRAESIVTACAGSTGTRSEQVRHKPGARAKAVRADVALRAGNAGIAAHASIEATRS